MKESEKEEMTQLIMESKELFIECKKKYDNDNARYFLCYRITFSIIEFGRVNGSTGGDNLV